MTDTNIENIAKKEKKNYFYLSEIINQYLVKYKHLDVDMLQELYHRINTNIFLLSYKDNFFRFKLFLTEIINKKKSNLFSKAQKQFLLKVYEY